jgi:hypothetical protein
LDDEDAFNRDREYNNRIKSVSDDLAKAVEGGANPVVIAKIVEQLNEAQATNTREDWDTQAGMTFSELLAGLSEQPKSLPTKWGSARERYPDGNLETLPT